MELVENELVFGLIVVAVVIVLVGITLTAMRLWPSIQENVPKYGPEVLGAEAIAHESINPRGFVYYQMMDGEAVVPDGTCYVLGDNLENSKDSRHFGFVPLGDVTGRVRYVFWPISRFGIRMHLAAWPNGPRRAWRKPVDPVLVSVSAGGFTIPS